MKRSSCNGLTVGIDINQLEALLVNTIREYSNDNEIIHWSETYRGLASRYRSRGSELDVDELNEIVTILDAFLNSAPSLPSSVVAQVHTFVGLMKAQQQMHDCAIQSFLKALWIESSDIRTPQISIALTTHRLGLAYGRKGNYGQAISLLERSLSCYKKDRVGADKGIFVNAVEALDNFRRLQHYKSASIRMSLRIIDENNCLTDEKFGWGDDSTEILSEFRSSHL